MAFLLDWHDSLLCLFGQGPWQCLIGPSTLNLVLRCS